jgi:hypothetical protein
VRLRSFIFLAGLHAFISGWGATNITIKGVSARLMTLKVEVVDTNDCRQKSRQFQNYHICTASIARVINEALCYVSNIIWDLLTQLFQVYY